MLKQLVACGLAWLLLAPIAGGQDEAAELSKVTGPACQAQVLKREGALVYCGIIAEEFEKFISENIGDGISKLIISSLGGDTNVAMRVSDLIEKHNVEIVVREICASACAHFLFVPAKRGSVEPGGLVIFHTTSAALEAARLRPDLPEFERLSGIIPAGAAKEREFYEVRGLNPALLTDPFIAMQPVCVGRDVEWIDGLPVMAYLSRYSWWLPLESDLIAYGMPPKDGFWPTSIRDFSSFDDTIKRYRLGSLAIWKSTRSSLGGLRELPICTDKTTTQ